MYMISWSVKPTYIGGVTGAAPIINFEAVNGTGLGSIVGPLAYRATALVKHPHCVWLHRQNIYFMTNISYADRIDQFSNGMKTSLIIRYFSDYV